MKARSLVITSLMVLSATACSRRGVVSTGDIEPVETPREIGIEDISAAAVNTAPTPMTLKSEAGPVVTRIQILLDRARFSVGVIDGRAAKNTAMAIYWFQKTQNLPSTSMVDSATYNRLMTLVGATPVVTQVTLTPDMLKGPFITLSHNVYDQAKMNCLCYASATEMLAERYHTSFEMMRKLNPGVGFASLKPGDAIWAPALQSPSLSPARQIARIQVAKTGNYVHAYASDGSLIYHFPSTLGSQYDPSPTGKYRVTSVAWNPAFRYDPTLFSDVPDTKPDAMLPPGPNSPVGVVWIALSKEHVGIHGTPNPDTIGLASSHGCVRLTNWDATRLGHAVPAGTRVEFTT